MNCCKQQVFPAFIPNWTCNHRHLHSLHIHSSLHRPQSLSLQLLSLPTERHKNMSQKHQNMQPVALAGTMLSFHWDCAITLPFIYLIKHLLFIATLHLRRRAVVPFHYWCFKWVEHWNRKFPLHIMLSHHFLHLGV